MEDDPYPFYFRNAGSSSGTNGFRTPPLAAGVGLAAGAGTWEKRAIALQEQLDLLHSQLARARSDSALLKSQTVTAEQNVDELRDALEDIIRDNAEVIDEVEEETEEAGAARSQALESQLATTKIGLAEAKFERDKQEGELRALRKQGEGLGFAPEELLAVGHPDDPEIHNPELVSADVGYLVGEVHQNGLLRVDHHSLSFVPEYVRRLATVTDQIDENQQKLEIELTAAQEASLGRTPSVQDVNSLASLWATLHVSSPTMPQTSFVGFKEQMHLLQDRVALIQASKAKVMDRHASANIDQKLSDPSHVLKPTHFASLVRFVPARYRSCDWSLVYSTTEHGMSLNTFYSRVAKLRPTLIAIRDTNGASFGCFVSTPWAQGHRFYGNGESFVFKATPEFRVYKWSGRDSFFQFSNHEYLAVGGGSHFALWVDSELLLGTSAESHTYNNPGLSPLTEFSIVVFEAWTLVTPGHFPKG